MKNEPIDITPDPRILEVLTHTEMLPIDALCELIDNAIDAFRISETPNQVNEIKIDLPTAHKIRQGSWDIRIADNGPGMTREGAKKMLTAGASTQTAFDRLGLFGVGFNIASGKFAQKTKLITAKKGAKNAIIIEMDISNLIEKNTFNVQSTEEPVSNYFKEGRSGTIVELSNQWPEGHANHEFPIQLVNRGPKRIKAILGRRYSTLLRERPIKILVNNDECTPFEHCVWDKKRYVDRGGKKIHAKIEFDKLFREQERCLECGATVKNSKCITNESHTGTSFIEERVRGWVGIQRFDDMNHFGIDVIRNGRAILTDEKDVFFQFKNDDGDRIKDYPIDGQYGRIIGEVHLNHVPVNFTKQNFEQSSIEWNEAIVFLRGASSFQPTQPDAENNFSPIKKLFDGYRRVRKPGRDDLYMAQIEPGVKPKLKRLDREKEKEFRKKFEQRIPGYYSDEKWFEQVDINIEDQSHNFENCPHSDCDGQNPVSAEVCRSCDRLLKSKPCINAECGKEIAQSADSCQHCGKSQVPEGPWKCRVCHHKNSPESDECEGCRETKGAVNPFDEEILTTNSIQDNDLSEDGVQVTLPDGSQSNKFNLHVRSAALRTRNTHLPMIVFPNRTKEVLTVFYDPTHSLFTSLQSHVYHAIAVAVADYIYSMYPTVGSGIHAQEHNHMILAWKVLEKYWRSAIVDDAEQVQDNINSLMYDIQGKMAANLKIYSDEIFQSMKDQELKDMVSSMKQHGVDVGRMDKLRESGNFMRHVPSSVVVSAFKSYPEDFFDNKVWNEPWNIPGMPDSALQYNHSLLEKTYLNCIEDCIDFLNYKNPNPLSTRRARLSYEILLNRFAT